MEVLRQNLVPEIVLFLLVLSFATVTDGQGQGVCTPQPCQNGGSCYPADQSGNSYFCSCFRDFRGQNCSSLTFEASIGISDIIGRNLIPHVNVTPPTDFSSQGVNSVVNAKRVNVMSQTSDPKTFRWTVNGTTLVTIKYHIVISSTSGQLTIFGKERENDGEYQVFVSNEYGTAFSNKVGLKFAVTGNFSSPQTPINISLTENEPYLLPCPPRSYSYRATYDWEAVALRRYIADNPLYAPRILMEPNGDLLFSYVNRSDFTTFISSTSGQSWSALRCSTTGLFGRDTRNGPDVYFYLTGPVSQQSSPKFYTNPAGLYTLATGDRFYLNCTAGGRPVPEIIWYRNKVLITDAGDRFQLQKHNRTLRLGSLGSTSHDGTYKCMAQSGLLKVESSFTIKVINKVTPIYSTDYPLYDIRAAKHGESVTLSCNAIGDSINSRTWYYNGQEINSRFANRWTVESSTGDLTLSNLQLKDFGLFHCVAKNPVSEDHRVTFLVVTGAPIPPMTVKTTSCANYSTNLTWTVFLHPDLPPPVSFIIERAFKQQSYGLPISSYAKLAEVSASTRSYVVNNLEPHHEFSFRIRARNQMGVGFPRISAFPSCATNSKRPSKFPENVGNLPIAFDGFLNISWTALDPSDWSGGNCIYRLFYRLNATNATSSNRTTFRCDQTNLGLQRLQPNSVYEISIRTENSEGPGPTSPAIFALSGQRAPNEPPAGLTILRVNADSVELEWSPLYAQPPKTLDGYWIYAWTGPIRLTQDVFRLEDAPLRAVLIIPDDAIRVQVAVRGVARGVVTELDPWTKYNMVVRGYNSGGLGPFSVEIISVTTLDSKDSYYILSLRITSETFTEDLKDETSSKFKTLKANITGEVSKLYEKQRWFKSAVLLSFSPGSVQAEIQLEAASPNMSAVYEVVSSMNNLGNFSLNRSVTAVRSELGIQSVTLSASNLRVYVSGNIVITCTVIGGPVDLNITWFKAGKTIGLSHRTKVETGVRHSRLTVRDVKAEDEGVYICQAIKGNQNGTSTITIKVVPVLEIKPRTVSKRVGDKATFTCGVVSGFRKGASVYIVEVTNKANEVRHQEVNFTATNLQITGGGESHVRKFVCEMFFQQEVLSRSEVAELIIIKPDAPKCPEDLLEGVLWSATAVGGTDVKPCPHGASGTASRDCSAEASWKDTNFVGCSSSEFIKLDDEIEAITGGFQSNITAQQVLSKLANATQPVTNNTKRPTEIFGGDLGIAVDILVSLANFNTKQGNVSTEEDVENFAEVASNLLESTNRITWQELEKVGQGRSQSLVKAMDDYGLGVATTFTGSTNTRVVQTKNLVMRIDRANQDSPLRVQGLIVAYNQSSIYLPPEAFRSSQDSRVITLVYLTLNDVLPLGKKDEKDKKGDEQGLSANTTIVSSTVHPRPQDVLSKPVKIILQNRRVNVPHGVTPQGQCVFWRPGESAVWQTSGCKLVPSESNITMTTCECNHLTIFASLMDPYGAPIGTAHKKALEIISIVGCSISLLAVLITIAVTVFFWRALKSPRSKVLLNVCVAIAVSCVLVICEGSARDNKVGCTVLAALLHYFLLALFCWMLCEGVLLYILLVKVFGGGAEDKVKYFYMFGWGFPAVIVAISLGATQADGYGSSEACWLDVDSGLIWAFIAPALLIILINIVVFILVIRQMMGTRHVQSKTEVEKVKAGVKASAVILPLLGITWLFGLLSFSSSTIAFKYIFAIANSLQGLMIFIFHCLLNKQIKDAIKRRRERGSTGVSSTPKTKPSPIQNAKHSTTLPGKGPANKKRSHRAQNDYEMVDSIVSDKSNTVSTLPNSRGDYKDAIIEIEIPDEQNMAERLPATKLLPQDEQEQQYDLPIFVNDNDSLPVGNGPVIPDHEDSEEESADEKTSTNSFIPHETQGNGLTREGSLEGSKRGEELVHDHKGSVDGVVNHIYEKPPDEYVPSHEEFQRENEVRLSLEDEQEDSRGGEELVHDNKGSVDGSTNHIYENPPDEYVPSYDEIHRRDEARLNLEDEDTAVENTDERTTENSLIPHNTQENTELKREGSLEGSMSRKDAESELGSIDGITNRIYENAPDEYDPSFVEIPGNDEVRLFLGERRSSSSSSSSSDTEVGSVEFSTEFNPVIDQEDVSCAVGDAPLEGALPSNSDETPVRRTAKKVEPREFDDDVKNDEDFERIMTCRRAKVDTMQRAADGFKIQTSSVQTSSPQSMWQKVRGKIHKGSYKVTKHGVTQDGVTQHDGASDESENKDDVANDVDDIELV